MNKQEIGKLLTLAALVDNRTVTPEACLMWHEIIGDLDYDAAVAAVKAHYDESTEWMMPAHVRNRVREARRLALPQTMSEAAIADPRPEIDHLLDLLDAEIISNGWKAPSRTSKNRDAIRLLLDRDKRTVEQVEAAIRWCQADEFWRSNILSAVKLREKYEQLRLAAARQPRSRAPSRAEERQQNNLNVVNQLAAMDAAEHRGIR